MLAYGALLPCSAAQKLVQSTENPLGKLTYKNPDICISGKCERYRYEKNTQSHKLARHKDEYVRFLDSNPKKNSEKYAPTGLASF